MPRLPPKTDEELAALPERSAIGDHFDVMTDPVTGFTERVRRPRQYFVMPGTAPFMFRDHAGEVWQVGLDEDGYFKHKIY